MAAKRPEPLTRGKLIARLREHIEARRQCEHACGWQPSRREANRIRTRHILASQKAERERNELEEEQSAAHERWDESQMEATKYGANTPRGGDTNETYGERAQADEAAYRTAQRKVRAKIASIERTEDERNAVHAQEIDARTKAGQARDRTRDTMLAEAAETPGDLGELATALAKLEPDTRRATVCHPAAAVIQDTIDTPGGNPDTRRRLSRLVKRLRQPAGRTWGEAFRDGLPWLLKPFNMFMLQLPTFVIGLIIVAEPGGIPSLAEFGGGLAIGTTLAMAVNTFGAHRDWGANPVLPTQERVLEALELSEQLAHEQATEREAANDAEAAVAALTQELNSEQTTDRRTERTAERTREATREQAPEIA